MSKVVRLEQWCVVYGQDPYLAPEAQPTRISGVLPSGKRVITSAVVRTRRRVVTTASGSRYELGTVYPEYLKWLEVNNLELDELRPLKPVKKLSVPGRPQRPDWAAASKEMN